MNPPLESPRNGTARGGAPRLGPEATEENGGSILVAERKPEGLLLSRLSEKNGEGGTQLMPVAEKIGAEKLTSERPLSEAAPSASTIKSPQAPTLKGVAFLTKIQHQLEAEAARDDEGAAISSQELAATIDALRSCLEALEKIESRALLAGQKQAQWLRQELSAMETLLSAE